MKNSNIKNLTLSALFIALGMVLPFFTGQIPEIGSALLPLHIPALLCGVVCGWKYGGAVGFILPIMRSFIFGMPPLFPVAIAMAFEMAVYAIVIGIAYRKLQGNKLKSIIALILSMVAGRIAWGTAMFILLGFSGGAFTFEAFLAGAILSAIPGIILQLVLIPILITALERAKLI